MRELRYILGTRKLIKDYLDMSYPNRYRRKTTFGEIVIYDRKELYVGDIVREVKMFFGKDVYLKNKSIVEEWYYSSPLVGTIPNSTNNSVLIYL